MLSLDEQDCIERLDDRFPDSPRVLVLQGMRREAAGKFEDALKLYDLILEQDETNAVSTPFMSWCRVPTRHPVTTPVVAARHRLCLAHGVCL